jgi:hypothetical protein
VSIDDLERKIDQFISDSAKNKAIQPLVAHADLQVIKYMPADYLADVLARDQLYASERAGFTWGDALYVAPLAFPFTTMMYGQVGVVGKYGIAGARLFNAADAVGVQLYQQWIVSQGTPYLELTTTVHANSANRELRNAFRTRFQIDVVCFRPDEGCLNYVNPSGDWWLAITHWDAYRNVGHGFSGAVRDLKWCVIAPDAFRPDSRGYKALLHDSLTTAHSWSAGHYQTLGADIRKAYAAGAKQVVICDFK